MPCLRRLKSRKMPRSACRSACPSSSTSSRPKRRRSVSLRSERRSVARIFSTRWSRSALRTMQRLSRSTLLSSARCVTRPPPLLQTQLTVNVSCPFFSLSSISRWFRLVERLGRIRKIMQRTECNLHNTRTLNCARKYPTSLTRTSDNAQTLAMVMPWIFNLEGGSSGQSVVPPNFMQGVACTARKRGQCWRRTG